MKPIFDIDMSKLTPPKMKSKEEIEKIRQQKPVKMTKTVSHCRIMDIYLDILDRQKRKTGRIDRWKKNIYYYQIMNIGNQLEHKDKSYAQLKKIFMFRLKRFHEQNNL
jgi:hypothetical protein